MICIEFQCIHRRLAAFVRSLNAHEKSKFRFVTSLDEDDWHEKQPEALFVETPSGARLVVEWKTLVFPEAFARDHGRDHMVAAIIEAGLGGALADHPYELRLSHALQGSKGELRSFARGVVVEILSSLDRINSGQVVGSPRPSRKWRFRRQTEDERDWNEPPQGLVIVWPSLGPTRLPSIDPIDEGFASKLSAMFQACEEKFRGYSDARRVLVIEPHGVMNMATAEWWQRLLAAVRPTQSIQEIWTGQFEWITETDQAWAFERAWPQLSGQVVDPMFFREEDSRTDA